MIMTEAQPVLCGHRYQYRYIARTDHSNIIIKCNMIPPLRLQVTDRVRHQWQSHQCVDSWVLDHEPESTAADFGLRSLKGAQRLKADITLR
eukprot:g75073.t1